MRNFWQVVLLLVFVFGMLNAPSSANAGLGPNEEYIIISGGPALKQWEGFRKKNHQHDNWWGNFIRTARIRMQQLQKASNGQVRITWLVYGPGYQTRETEDGAPLVSNIISVRDKYNVNLKWFRTGDEVINYLNSGMNRRQTKIGGLEYFGHSNKYCFTFDYSNRVLGASSSFLHERDLKKIKRGIFSRDAFCKSWGCHTGESFSAKFKGATGVKMIGAVGKTDYSDTWRMILPTISSSGGRWTQ